MYFVDVLNEFECKNSDTVYVTVNLPIKIIDFKDTFGMMFYPNPAGDYLSFRTDKPVGEKIIIRIINSIGKVSHIEIIENTNSSIEKEIDISKLKSGVHLIQVNTEKSAASFSFIKQ